MEGEIEFEIVLKLGDNDLIVKEYPHVILD